MSWVKVSFVPTPLTLNVRYTLNGLHKSSILSPESIWFTSFLMHVKDSPPVHDQ